MAYDDHGCASRRPGKKSPVSRPVISTHEPITPECRLCFLPLVKSDKGRCPRCVKEGRIK